MAGFSLANKRTHTRPCLFLAAKARAFSHVSSGSLRGRHLPAEIAIQDRQTAIAVTAVSMVPPPQAGSPPDESA